MPSTTAVEPMVTPLSLSETQADEGSLPFDLTMYVSRNLRVSMDEATRLLADWMREGSRAARPFAEPEALP